MCVFEQLLSGARRSEAAAMKCFRVRGRHQRGILESQRSAPLAERDTVTGAFDMAANRYLSQRRLRLQFLQQNHTSNFCRYPPTFATRYKSLKSVVYENNTVMRIFLSSIITLFSPHPRIPGCKICITQLRIRAARLQIISALFAVTAHTDNKQCNFKRLSQEKKGATQTTIRAPLIGSIINNSVSSHKIWKRA